MMGHAYAQRGSPLNRGAIAPQTVEETRARIEAIARLMDSAFQIPGTTIRVGADSLLNLIPGVGLALSKSVSAYLIYEARRIGAPVTLIARMAATLGVDFVISAIPVVGWVGDVFYRANNKNIALLREHLDKLYPGSAVWEHPPHVAR